MRVPDSENIRTLRLSLSVLGDGFVEAVADQTLIDIAKQQCAATRGRICGQVINVPIVESKSERDARRPLRLEEPAREPRLVLGRRVPERDGHHERAAARRRSCRSPAASRAPTKPNSPTETGLIDDVEPLRALHARDQGAAARRQARRDGRREARRAALRAGRLRDLPRADAADRSDGHQADERRSRSRRRSATRSSTRTATSCCTTSAPATAS